MEKQGEEEVEVVCADKSFKKLGWNAADRGGGFKGFICIVWVTQEHIRVAIGNDPVE